MAFDNYTGRQFMMGVAGRIYLLGVVSGLILAVVVYLGIKLIF